MTPILAQTTSQTGLPSIVFLVLMVGVFWFLIIRPQRNRMRFQQRLQAGLEVGDQVQTIGGVLGRVRELNDTTVLLEVESGLIRVTRRAIAGKVGDGS